jgi:hypothetical protein
MDNEKIHKFEAAGLGKAPFRCVGLAKIPSPSLAEANPDAYNNALRALPPKFRCGTCHYCGQPIMNNYLIVSSDGHQFAVGCECVAKTGDAGLTNKTKALKRQADREARAKARQEKYERELQEQRDRNGGLTDDELWQQKQEAKRQAEADKARERAMILGELASRMRDGKKGFRDSIALTMDEGGLPYGRGLEITCDILAKQEGRRGSKAYDAEYNRVEKVLAKADAIR